MTGRAFGLGLALALVLGGEARAEDIEGDIVYLPMPAGETLTVENKLGGVRVRGWDEPRVRIAVTKRAKAPGVLDRLKVRVDVNGGRLRIATGVVSRDQGFRPVPLAGAGIDLVVDAPRAMTVRATTWSGPIDAAGFRSGAHLESEHGEIRAADLKGRIDTRTLEGRQSLQGIEGTIDASGIDGDLELESIDGPTLDATVHKGQITAREVRTPVVRVRTTMGAIVWVGGLSPGGRYELSTIEGDVRLVLRPAPFRVTARAPAGRITMGFQLGGRREGAGVVEGEHAGGGASLELASGHGAVSVLPAKP